MSNTVTVHIPSGWGDDNLTSFTDLARENQFASFVQAPAQYKKLLDVDKAFMLICGELKDPGDLLTPLFLLKSHASYRGAVQLAMSGQSAEAFMVMRGCLESALYGLYIYKNDKAAEIWMDRMDNEKAKQKARDEFTIGKMWKCLKAVDWQLQTVTETMYDKTIDFGGHPNAAAMASAVKTSKTATGMQFQLAYLSAEPELLKGTMKSAAQTGVIALSVYQYVFKDRYNQLGLNAQFDSLKKDVRILWRHEPSCC